MSQMYVLALTVTTMIAFAANSILCRLALKSGNIDPGSFTLVRILAGALTLFFLRAMVTKPSRTRLGTIGGSWFSALALLGYAALFSFAYMIIDAGIGALTLFGFVQISMIGWNFLKGNKLSFAEWTGLILAFSGLSLLTVPGKNTPEVFGLLLMAAAGICWGVYSLRGRSSTSPIQTTSGNFIRAIPGVFFLFAAFYRQSYWNQEGVLLAIFSGSITSGLGYCLWYMTLGKLKVTEAAIAQLSVPIIASLGGVLFLQEAWTERTILSGGLIILGIAIATLSRKSNKLI